MLIEIKEYKGCKIKYNEGFDRFEAFDSDGKRIADAPTRLELEKKLDSHAKHKRRFRKLQVIDVSEDHICEITSRDVEHPDKEVWVSWTKDGKVEHGKKVIASYGWNYRDNEHTPTLAYYFVLNNPENLLVLGKVKAAQTEIEKLRRQIDDWRKHLYKEPVTPKMLDNMEAEKEKELSTEQKETEE